MSGLWQMRDGGEMDEEAALSGGAARRSLPPTDGNNLRRTSTYGEDWDQEERDLIERRQAQPGWRVDRGAGFYQEERRRHKRPSLVETGRHAGRSRVTLEGIEWGVLLRHVLKRDFFNYSVNAPIGYILLALCVCYFLTVSAWALTYYITWKFYGQCFHGFEDSGLVSAFLFSVETQQTIGYGSRFPGDCWLSAALIASHSVESIILDSLVLGIALARISHPKNRGRTILLSDCAVVSRRDGILKL
ncbi:hypothetical protein FOA52_016066 [Chlamydomonas sp. UWO 241]|nr:hypothetical protein FOA52_016066 [Chlamydomonas sp. UWO 241]